MLKEDKPKSDHKILEDCGSVGRSHARLAASPAERIGMRHNADTKNVAASRYRTFWAPIMAIPTPLTAGPIRRPILVVL